MRDTGKIGTMLAVAGGLTAALSLTSCAEPAEYAEEGYADYAACAACGADYASCGAAQPGGSDSTDPGLSPD